MVRELANEVVARAAKRVRHLMRLLDEEEPGWQARTARSCGVHQTVLSRIHHGKQDPSLQVLVSLSYAWGLRLDYFLVDGEPHVSDFSEDRPLDDAVAYLVAGLEREVQQAGAELAEARRDEDMEREVDAYRRKREAEAKLERLRRE